VKVGRLAAERRSTNNGATQTLQKGNKHMSTAQNKVSPEQNQEVLRRVIEEGFNKGNYDALDALFVTLRISLPPLNP
jgi:hypothetical protein